MGIDLYLLPVQGHDVGMWFAHDVLSVDRNGALFDSVRELQTLPMPRALSTFVARLPNGEAGYGDALLDSYGVPLRYVHAVQLRGVDWTLTRSPQNRAIEAFVRALPASTPIVLWWH
jgi:hypothetical protein